MSAFVEQVLDFSCQGDALTGVLAQPATPGDLAVLVIVGGPQYRAGSHRQFVSLCRSLAGAGYPALRFDYRGMGDSTGELRDFEQVEADIGAAIDALQTAVPSAKRFVLWGLCDGASAALLYLEQARDPRVHGLCLVNPWVRSPATLARTQLKHYYLQRLTQKEFWLKLLRGGVGTRALGGLWHSLMASRRAAAAAQPATTTSQAAPRRPFVERMLDGLRGFRGETAVLLSGNDYTAREFDELLRSDKQWQATVRRARVTPQELPGADHTCSDPRDQAALEQCTIAWLARAMSVQGR